MKRECKNCKFYIKLDVGTMIEPCILHPFFNRNRYGNCKDYKRIWYKFWVNWNLYNFCEVCDCDDCKKGTYRYGSWHCPVLNKQICDVCCYYDTDAIEYNNIRKQCKEINCEYLKE